MQILLELKFPWSSMSLSAFFFLLKKLSVWIILFSLRHCQPRCEIVLSTFFSPNPIPSYEGPCVWAADFTEGSCISCVFSRETETTGHRHIDVQNEIRYEELAHVIMEAKRPHDLPSVSWKPSHQYSFRPNPKA